MGISRFEELVAWQKARLLAAAIYRITAQGAFSKDFGFKDQIQRAGVSVMSNVAEGFERGSSAEFHQYLVIAKASCAELRAQLYLALDVGYIDRQIFDETMKLGMRRLSLLFSLSLSLWERAGVRVRIQRVIPHPNPLPEGEGTYSAFP